MIVKWYVFLYKAEFLYYIVFVMLGHPCVYIDPLRRDM
jgi:hypothetical protein